MYESTYMLLIFLALLLSRKKMKRPGDLAAWLALLSGCGRVVFESLRADCIYISFVGINQVISILLALFILILFSGRAVKSRRFRATDLLGWFGALLCVGASFLAEFFMGAETALRNVTALAASMLILILISALYYRSVLTNPFGIPARFAIK
jgi:hypothetical protein